MKDKTNFLWLSMLLLTAMLFTLPLKAQVTIGSLDVPRATLDVVAANPSSATAAEGVIAPRLTGDQIKAKDGAYGADQRGVIVYATDAVGAASTKTAAITAAGYYYFDGSVWKTFGSGGASGGTTVNVLTQLAVFFPKKASKIPKLGTDKNVYN